VKCAICGRKAKFRYSPDLDILGLGACAKHKHYMSTAYFLLLTEGEREYRKFIANARKNEKVDLLAYDVL
jgi:hypothetical protein